MELYLTPVIECFWLALKQMQASLSCVRARREVLLARLGDFNAAWNSLSVEQKYIFVGDPKGVLQLRSYD